MNNSRIPQIGDLIIYLDKNTNIEYPGIVIEIRKNKWGHGSVFVNWGPNSKPSMYSEQTGFAGMNVHNLRRIFRIFRNGNEIL